MVTSASPAEAKNESLCQQRVTTESTEFDHGEADLAMSVPGIRTHGESPRLSDVQRLPGPEHYGSSYDSLARFASYWIQIEQILCAKSPPVLEIGVGTSTVTTYLRRLQVPVTTCDIDPALRPDVRASIDSLPFRDEAFGTVLACQVLEHLPYERLPQIFKELGRVARTHVIVSLPNAGIAYRVMVDLPLIGKRQAIIDVSRVRRWREVRGSRQHFWELGVADYDTRGLRRIMREAGLEVVTNFRLFENPYYHFFVLRKVPANRLADDSGKMGSAVREVLHRVGERVALLLRSETTSKEFTGRST